jgi:methyl-accepting chemotaxis protein
MVVQALASTPLSSRWAPRGRSFSLSTKLGLAASLCVVVSLLVNGIAVGVQTSADAEAAAKAGVRATAAYAAEQVQADVHGTFQAIQTQASALEVARARQTPPSRAQLDDTLKQMLARHGHWLAAYSLWEPNALDGDDASHARKGPQDDATGRFVSYWNRGSGEIKVEPLLDYETAGANDWYDLPRRTGRSTLVEPYLYKVGGKDMLITSLVTPIKVDGRFVGIVGVDMLLDGLQQTLAKVRTVPGARVMLVSAGGKYVSHPDPKEIGQTAQDLSTEALAHVKAGEAYEYTDGQGMVRVLAPVHADPDAQPWSLCIQYDEATARAPAMATLQRTAWLAVLCALLASAALMLILRRLLRPMRALADTMRALADGHSNLRVALPEHGNDELAVIAHAFNAFVGKLRGVFEDVRDTSGAVDGAAGEISSGNADLSSRTELQAGNLQGISSSMVELSQGVQTTAQTALQADQLARQAADAAQRSQTVMADAVAAMEAVGTSSQRIADITAVIDGIAFQTNILALNAAVEAARAGEHGRGFAVVAGEVRTLAQRAASAAKDIKVLIGESGTRVENGADRIRVSGETVAELSLKVREVSSLINAISLASGEQSRGIAHVEVAIGELDGMTQQNAALVEQAAAAAGSLKHQTQRLSDTLGAFI